MRGGMEGLDDCFVMSGDVGDLEGVWDGCI